MHRKSNIERTTKETKIQVQLDLDGNGICKIHSQMGFFDHMLNALHKHALFDINIKAKGDLHVDAHHTIEDIGLVLGQALNKALDKKDGIQRFGQSLVPMDEALVQAVVDLSGRPHLQYSVPCKRKKIGNFDLTLLYDFFQAFAQTGLFTLHIKLIEGHNPHHIYEAAFKAVGRALGEASRINPRIRGALSTKGKI
ncbi:MAG: imidazoleglycerol-phosphate dehydratase HisB [Chlamydiota bacterium]|nr:imidazoleglycerol-phosphate dehydratase HisB [Chlamydiota bacterium]